MYKVLIVISFFLFSCGNNSAERTHNQPSTIGQSTNHTSFSNDDDSDESADYDIKDGLEDGTHSATVQYYNPQTGHSATYNLEVEVEDGEVN